MKRADAALTAGPVSRPGKPGRMKNQAFSFALTVRPLTFSAIDGLAGQSATSGMLPEDRAYSNDHGRKNSLANRGMRSEKPQKEIRRSGPGGHVTVDDCTHGLGKALA